MTATPLGGPRSRADLLTVAVLVAVAAAAWVLTGWSAEPHMRIGILTGQADMTTSMSSTSVALGVFLVAWTVMMIAMMFPAAVPVVLTFRRWAVHRGRPATTVGAFVAGYLAVWSAIGVAVYGLMVLLQHAVSPGSAAAVRLGGGLLVVAGLYQLTPLKDVCLTHCRSPLGVVMQHSRRLADGHRGPFAVGLRHGAYCLGCCWALMLVLVLLGMMHLAWMATVAAVVFVEKVAPAGALVSRGVGVAVAVAGVVVVVAPSVLLAA